MLGSHILQMMGMGFARKPAVPKAVHNLAPLASWQRLWSLKTPSHRDGESDDSSTLLAPHPAGVGLPCLFLPCLSRGGLSPCAPMVSFSLQTWFPAPLLLQHVSTLPLSPSLSFSLFLGLALQIKYKFNQELIPQKGKK